MKNPYPDMIPDDVWEAQQKVFLARTSTERRMYWEEYEKVRSKYVVDKSFNRLERDAQGNFVKINPHLIDD